MHQRVEDTQLLMMKIRNHKSEFGCEIPQTVSINPGRCIVFPSRDHTARAVQGWDMQPFSPWWCWKDGGEQPFRGGYVCGGLWYGAAESVMVWLFSHQLCMHVKMQAGGDANRKDPKSHMHRDGTCSGSRSLCCRQGVCVTAGVDSSLEQDVGVVKATPSSVEDGCLNGWGPLVTKVQPLAPLETLL